MPVKFLLASLLVLSSLAALGCGQASQAKTPERFNTWTTYTSPDKRVSFAHPSNLEVTVRMRHDADEPALALFMSSSDESLELTLVMRISDVPLPDYCESMVDACLDSNTTATSKREPVLLGGAAGFRQEFRSGSGALADEFVSLALQAKDVYVIFTCSHSAVRRGELKPICERIVNSLTITPSAKP
ncbi:MAG: hypothetical protein L0211_06535 [Planctomycetaceae bacterium]|nr:hypothetical protein [Planctomycetaceae bacterium]